MAKGKKGGYDDALTSIFDFIFTSAKKKEKKPAFKPSGVPDGSDEMARALAEMAAYPANYVSDGMLYAPNRLTGNNIIGIELEPGGESIELKPNNIIKALRDPNTFIDGVFDAQKEANKIKRYQKGASYIDQALAIGIGIKAGMGVQDAMTFGATARGTYTDNPGITTEYDIRTRHNKLAAENAVLEANVELAKAQAQAEGLNPATDDYANRVYELTKTAKADLKKDTEALRKAMKSTKYTRQLGFEGSVVDRTDPRNITERNNQINNAINDVRRSLVDQGLAPDRIDKMVAGLQNEIEQSDRYGDRITAYRMQYQKNQSALAQLADTPEEAIRHIEAGNTALVLERMYGGDVDPRSIYSNVGSLREEFDKEISETSAAMAASTDPVYQAALKAHLDELNKNLGLVSQKSSEYKARLNGTQEFWRGTTSTSKVNADAEYKNFTTARLLDAERSKLNMKFMTTTDEFEKRQIRAEMYRIEKARDLMDSKMPATIGTRFMDGYNRNQAYLATLRNPKDIITGKAWMKPYYGGMPGTLGKSAIQSREFNDKRERKTIDSTIVLPKDVYGQQINRLRAIYPNYSRLTNLYYLTPNSIASTLFLNGEGFSYIAEMRQRALQRSFYMDKGNHLDDFIRTNPLLFGSIKNLVDRSGNVDHDVLAANYLDVMDNLSANEHVLPPALKDILVSAERRYGSLARFAKAGQWMNTNVNMRIRNMTSLSYYLKKPKIASFLSKTPLSRFLPVLSGGVPLKTFIRGGVHSAAAALGIATGGVATFIIEGIVWVGTEIAYKLAKPISKVLLVALVGICGLCGALIFMFQVPGGLAGPAGLSADVGFTEMTPGDQYYCGEIYTGPPGDPYGNRYPEQPLPPGVVVPPDTGDVPRNATCPVGLSAYCYQGPGGGFSHAAMGTGAIDLGTNAGVWTAPTDGVVTQAISDMECEWDRGKSRGGQMKFVDSAGNTYRLLHADPLVGVGEVKAGTAIGRITLGLPVSKCWTGPHYHLDVTSGGSWVNAQSWYNALGCGISCP